MQLTRLLCVFGVLLFYRCETKCEVPSPYFFCHGAVVIIADGTHYMHSHNQIRKEISYIQDQIVPSLGLGKEFEVAFMLSGAGDNYQTRTRYVGSHKEACSELNTLQGIADKKALQKESLREVLDHMYWSYQFEHALILFSKSEDEDEISEAAEYVRKYLRQYPITVVALSGNANPWKRFPAVSVYAVDVNVLDSSGRLDYCIAERSCAFTKEYELTTAITYLDSSSTKRATSRRATAAETTAFDSTASNKLTGATPANPPTTHSVVVNVDGPCVCNYSTSWNDVMFVFESTESTGETGLHEMLAHLQSSMYHFNIQPRDSAEQLCTRIGVIVYGLTSLLYAPLGSLSRDDFLAIDNLPYFGDQIANLEDALRMASLQFQTESDRANARNVIVLMATSYYVGGAFAPGQVAAQFKEDNGVLVVYNYVEEHGFPESKLKSIASPGFFLTNTEDNLGSDIGRALCDANCFCRLGYDAFETDPLRHTPTAGCYSAKQASTSYQLAQNRCRNENGLVALAKQENQTEYLEKKFNNLSSFWIGLKWDQVRENYVWADGSLLSATPKPWAPSSPHQSGVDCVRVVPQGSDVVWAKVDCREAFVYSCEVTPCDSQTLCTQDV